MRPADVISLGALLVALVSIVVGAFVAPRVAAAVERARSTRERQADVYASTVRLLRARVQELEHAALGWPVHDEGPEDDETAVITARLLIYAGTAVWELVDQFFKAYWSTSNQRLAVDLALAAGQDNAPARLEISQVRSDMVKIVDQVLNAMRDDLGLDRLPVHAEKAPAPPP